MENKEKIKIGKTIQEIRKSNGYTQEKLAEAVEVSVRYISDIEQDKSKPSYEILIRICNLFKIGINQDLVIKGLGFITFKKNCDVTLWLTKECKYLIRDTII